MLITTASGYARGITRVNVSPVSETYVEVTLGKVGAIGMVDAANGGRLEGERGASVTFPGSIFMTGDGSMMTGEVEVSLTPLDPSDPQQMPAFPGTFRALDSNGDEGLLETFVPTDISATGPDGSPLSMVPGMTAEVTFPVYEPDTAPQRIALWSLNPETGLWREEGVADRTVDSNNLPIYKGTIGHMSWWNCDAFLSSVTFTFIK